MRLFTLLCITSVFLALSSCKKDKEGSLTIHFLPQYDGQPLTMFSTKTGTGIEQLQFTHLSFLVSELVLLDAPGHYDLAETEYIDISFDDLNAAEEGYTFRIDQIPAATYEGIRFGIGVPADLNAKTPSQFTSGHPLSKTGYYWEAWDSYIFMKIEGRLDTLGSGAFDTGLAFHTGTDDLYRTLESTFSIAIEEGQETELNIAIDYKDLLAGIDIKSNPQNHNPQDSLQIARIVNNLQTSVVLFQ